MPLSSTQRESAIIAVLRALDAIHPNTLSADDLRTPLRFALGREFEEKEVSSLLTDMKGENFVIEVPSRLNAAVMRWQRTEPGRALLESLKLL